MKIRKVKESDLKRINDLFMEEYGKPPYNEKWDKKVSLAKLKMYLKRCSFFVLNEGKKLIGFIIFHIDIWDKGTVGYMDELVIDKRFQGKGYGRIFMKFAEDYTKKKGVKSYELMTDRKAKAFSIYKKLGYKELKDTVHMSKKAK